MTDRRTPEPDRPSVYFVRHGQTDWNAEQRFQGQHDTDLNDIGRAQADRNGATLRGLIGEAAGFDFVASPLRRTRETMQRVRAAMELSPNDYRTDATLIEVNFGDWQGQSYAELRAADPAIFERRHLDRWNFVPPGNDAESYAMLAERIKPWFTAIAQPTVCVAHGGVLRAIFVLAGVLQGREAGALDIPQDRILRLRDGKLEWL